MASNSLGPLEITTNGTFEFPIDGKAMMSKSFTLAQAEYVAAAMIAAISLAKNGG